MSNCISVTKYSLFHRPALREGMRASGLRALLRGWHVRYAPTHEAGAHPHRGGGVRGPKREDPWGLGLGPEGPKNRVVVSANPNQVSGHLIRFAER